jgi:phosphatidylglycerol:prolipoprotein diacylglycerol transferase
MHRDLVELGPFTLRAFGLALVLAFAFGAWLSFRRGRSVRIPESFMNEVVQVALVAGIVGARLQYVIANWHEFAPEPWRAFAVWEGGLTYYGGAILATFATLWWGKHRGVPLLMVGDVLAPAVAVGDGIGRLGCFMNGCCYGRPSDVPWAVQFPPDSFADRVLGAVHVHPTQIYQSLWGFGVGFFLLWLGLRRERGLIFWTFLILLPLGRILLDPFRYYEPGSRVLMGGEAIPVSQVIAAILLGIGVTGFALMLRKRSPA